MFDYKEYEKECDRIRKDNDELLSLFEDDLTNAGLSSKTIRRHLSNVDFYINEYLLREEPLTIEYGTAKLDTFLGDFFIRKCMWSTPASIKSTAASIKKFYRCMLDHNKLDKKYYDCLCDDIKENLEQWQDECAIYNDPDAPNPFDWF